MLSQIIQKYPALEKQGGNRKITEIGKKLNHLTRETLKMQRVLIQNQTNLRIGTNREFGAQILGPHFSSLLKEFPKTHFLIYTFEHGTEEALLNGQTDIGIDCDRPNDPDIAYKLLIKEPVVAVCSPLFAKKHKNHFDNHQLHLLPYLSCSRIQPDKIFLEQENRINALASFNDIAVTRSVCLKGLGWALLPKYAVKKELENKKLVLVLKKEFGNYQYGLRWSRSRKIDKHTIEKLSKWLKERVL